MIRRFLLSAACLLTAAIACAENPSLPVTTINRIGKAPQTDHIVINDPITFKNSSDRAAFALELALPSAGLSADVNTLLGAADYAAIRTDIGLVIGTNVQAQSAALSSLAALGASLSAGDILYATGTNAVTRLPAAAEGQVLTISAGLPVWRYPFAPDSLDSLTLWLRGDDLSGADASAVGRWLDASVASHAATQATGGLQPALKLALVNGHNAVRFDGATGQYLQTDQFTRTGAQTTYVVFRFAALTGNKSLFDAAQAANRYRAFQAAGFFSDDLLAFSGSGACAISSASLDGTWCVAKFLFNGASSSITLNGELNVTGDAGSNVANGFTIGNAQDLSSDMNGDIAVVANFDGAIADGSADDVKLWRYFSSYTRLTQIWCDGNSQTSGFGATAGTGYPYQLQKLFTTAVQMHNVGVSAQTTVDMSSDAATQIDAHINAYAQRKIVVAWEGTNDLFFGASAVDAYSHLVTYCQARRAAGYKVVVLTLLPRSDAGTPGTFEADRQTVNTSIRANWSTFSDALYDCAANPNIGPPGSETNLTYYQSGGVHLNATGDAIIASGVKSAIDTKIP